MKGVVCPVLLLLFAVFVSACMPLPPATPVSPSPSAMISPGDQIGDFHFTQAGNETVSYATTMRCPADATTRVRSCTLRVGTKANLATGFHDDDLSDGKSLDDLWSRLTQEMSVDGRTVDLKAFGYVDEPLAALGKVRFANIVAVAEKPGKITVRSTGTFDGNPFEHTMVLTFTASGN